MPSFVLLNQNTTYANSDSCHGWREKGKKITYVNSATSEKIYVYSSEQYFK